MKLRKEFKKRGHQDRGLMHRIYRHLSIVIRSTFINLMSKSCLRRELSSIRVVVYTAIFAGKDKLLNSRRFPGVKYVCFTDDASLDSDIWEIIVQPHTDNPRRASRRYKIMPHEFFQDYQYSIWVDGNRIPRVDPRYLILRFLLREHKNIAMFAHPERNCIYQEAELCINQQRANPLTVKTQMRKYIQEGYPPDNGLTNNSVVLRKHQQPALVRTMENWWAELENHSVRDQLSFNYVSWKNNLQYGILPGYVAKNVWFSSSAHAVHFLDE